MALKDKIINNVRLYYSLSHPQSHHRFLSWEHCYDEFGKVFSKNPPATSADKDQLALHLATYLASWGMYRGSSFLLQVDYKVHVPVVEKITVLNSVGDFEYRDLFGIAWSELDSDGKKNNLKKLFFLSDAISGCYDTIRANVKGRRVNSKVSRTLVTKVLMGTLGCVPAYDTYFKKGIKKAGITPNFSPKSISDLIYFYQTNKSDFDNEREQKNMITSHKNVYPEMKFLDMGFWKN